MFVSSMSDTDSPLSSTLTAAEPTNETVSQASASISPQTNLSTTAPAEPSQTNKVTAVSTFVVPVTIQYSTKTSVAAFS